MDKIDLVFKGVVAALLMLAAGLMILTANVLFAQSDPVLQVLMGLCLITDAIACGVLVWLLTCNLSD